MAEEKRITGNGIIVTFLRADDAKFPINTGTIIWWNWKLFKNTVFMIKKVYWETVFKSQPWEEFIGFVGQDDNPDW